MKKVYKYESLRTTVGGFGYSGLRAVTIIIRR